MSQAAAKSVHTLSLYVQPQLLSSLLKGMCALLRKGELSAAIKHLLVAIVTQLYSDLSGGAPVIARELQVVSTLADCLRLCGSMQTEVLKQSLCTWLVQYSCQFRR